MINFKDITLSDRAEIEPCFLGNRCRTCDYSFANLYSWAPKFKTQFAVIDYTLFLQFQGDENEVFYMMPVGKMPASKSLPLIIKHAEENNIKFEMKGVTHKMWDAIQNAMPNTFKYVHDRDNAEYLYLAEKLISLSGKKLQKKRNHINRFKADNPNWLYYPLISQNEIDECLKMLDVWEGINIDKQQGDFAYDYIAAKTMLDNFHELDLKGGAIKINGKIVAFTIGRQLTDDTMVVHIEKALADVNGAYTIINQQFVEHEGAQFKYINREEDMGVDGLRQAKMSYEPEILLEEGVVTFR